MFIGGSGVVLWIPQAPGLLEALLVNVNDVDVLVTVGVDLLEIPVDDAVGHALRGLGAPRRTPTEKKASGFLPHLTHPGAGPSRP